MLISVREPSPIIHLLPSPLDQRRSHHWGFFFYRCYSALSTSLLVIALINGVSSRPLFRRYLALGFYGLIWYTHTSKFFLCVFWSTVCPSSSGVSNPLSVDFHFLHVSKGHPRNMSAMPPQTPTRVFCLVSRERMSIFMLRSSQFSDFPALLDPAQSGFSPLWTSLAPPGVWWPDL